MIGQGIEMLGPDVVCHNVCFFVDQWSVISQTRIDLISKCMLLG